MWWPLASVIFGVVALSTTSPLPLESDSFPATARWTIEGDSILVIFEYPATNSKFVGGLHLIDADNDSIPDGIDWSRPTTGTRDCAEFFDNETATRIGNLPDSSCYWYLNNSLEIKLANPAAINPGDTIAFKSYVVAGFEDTAQNWKFSPATTYEVLAPQTLLAPTMEIFSDGFPVGNVPVEVPMCSSIVVGAYPTNDYHGRLPSYTWSVFGIACTHTAGDGSIDDFTGNSNVSKDLDAIMQGVSAGSVQAPRGSEFLNLTDTDLESGCTYSIMLTLVSRWGVSVQQAFMLQKLGPNTFDWRPQCGYHCNPTTCEEGTCEDSGCVCHPGRWGPTCRGTCSCSPYRSTGRCNKDNGDCECFRGMYGPQCNQRAEWQDIGWTSCEPCDADKSTQTAIRACVAVCNACPADTEVTVINETNCEKLTAPAQVRDCIPPKCPCTVPPPVPGLEYLNTVKRCNGTLSGQACRPVCEQDRIAIGEYRCYAGSYIEFPACVEEGGYFVPILGAHISFRLQSRTNTRLTANTYLAEMTPTLKSVIMSAVLPAVVPSEDITFSTRNLETGEKETLMASERRLSSTDLYVEISTMIAISSGEESDAETVIVQLLRLPSSEQLAIRIDAEYNRLCNENTDTASSVANPCPAGSVLHMTSSIPQRTQLYRGASTTTSTTTTTTRTTVLRISTLVAMPSPPVTTAEEADSGGTIAATAAITASSMLLCMFIIGGCVWWRRKSLGLARIVPVVDDMFKEDAFDAWKEKEDKAAAKAAREQ